MRAFFAHILAPKMELEKAAQFYVQNFGAKNYKATGESCSICFHTKKARVKC